MKRALMKFLFTKRFSMMDKGDYLLFTKDAWTVTITGERMKIHDGDIVLVEDQLCDVPTMTKILKNNKKPTV